MTRAFQPLTDTEWPESAAGLRDGFAGALNVYRTMAHNPALLNAWAPLRHHIVKSSALTPQQSEVVILRTGHHMGAAYEWAHHVVRGRAVGLSDARIASLRGALADMQPEDATLARAVDETCADHRLSPDTQTALVALVGAHGMFDVIATVGFYTVLGVILNSFDTPIDDDIQAELARNPAP